MGLCIFTETLISEMQMFVLPQSCTEIQINETDYIFYSA